MDSAAHCSCFVVGEQNCPEEMLRPAEHVPGRQCHDIADATSSQPLDRKIDS